MILSELMKRTELEITVSEGCKLTEQLLEKEFTGREDKAMDPSKRSCLLSWIEALDF